MKRVAAVVYLARLDADCRSDRRAVPVKRLPDHLPILDRRRPAAGFPTRYVERELDRPVDLCDSGGRLEPAAIGWSRRPLVRANLSGHWLRKKRWNFWNWIAPEFVLSVTLADVDYASLCTVAFSDFETGDELRTTSFGRPGRFAMPEHVERSVAFRGGGITYRHVHAGGDIEVSIRAQARAGEIAADFAIRRPPGHESLNVVVPWSPARFQLNSKHAALPCEGELRAGDRSWAMRPERCHGVQDWGRGVWPHRSFWNWGVATGIQDGASIGINMGAKWTTGTGSNENGITLDGRLFKVMEDLRWDYEPGAWARPWRVRAEQTGALDLTFEPRLVQRSALSLGLVSTGGVCCFGSWRGRIAVDGREIAIRELPGWAEEFAHRW
jgi:hypothetical protein